MSTWSWFKLRFWFLVDMMSEFKTNITLMCLHWRSHLDRELPLSPNSPAGFGGPKAGWQTSMASRMSSFPKKYFKQSDFHSWLRALCCFFVGVLLIYVASSADHIPATMTGYILWNSIRRSISWIDVSSTHYSRAGSDFSVKNRQWNLLVPATTHN